MYIYKTERTSCLKLFITFKFLAYSCRRNYIDTVLISRIAVIQQKGKYVSLPKLVYFNPSHVIIRFSLKKE